MKSNNQKRALVTGATGFIGGRLTERLIEESIPVRALVRHPEKGAQLHITFSSEITGRQTAIQSFPR